MARSILLCAVLLAGSRATATAGPDPDDSRASFNYMNSCRGCHSPDARGLPAIGIPRISNYIGKFLSVRGGREYLVQVPGVAYAALDDSQLAELLNWIVVQFAGESMPLHFERFTAREVHALRQHPLLDPKTVRATLVAQIDSSQSGR